MLRENDREKKNGERDEKMKFMFLYCYCCCCFVFVLKGVKGIKRGCKGAGRGRYGRSYPVNDELCIEQMGSVQGQPLSRVTELRTVRRWSLSVWGSN